MSTTIHTNTHTLDLSDPVDYEIYQLRLSRARITAHIRATDEVLASALALIAHSKTNSK